MYQIYCDDVLLFDPRTAEYTVTEGQLTQKLNTSGTLTFVLPPGRTAPTPLKSKIRLTDRGETIFWGRMLTSSTDEEGFSTITCEGELGELHDCIIRPYHFAGEQVQQNEASAIWYLEELVMLYPGKDATGFTVVKDRCSQDLWKLEYSERSSSAYPTVLDEIMDQLIDSQGGYLRINHEPDDTGKDVRYLDYVTDQDYGKDAEDLPPIQLGLNLLDLEWNLNAEDLITVLVPLGKRTDETYLTVKDAQVDGNPYGKDYLENTQAIQQYGRIEGSHRWNDITDATDLYNKGMEYLEQASALSVSLTATAADLSLAGYDVSPIRLGDQVRVIDPIVGLDTTMICTQRKYNLLDPTRDEITLGGQVSTLTGNLANEERSN